MRMKHKRVIVFLAGCLLATCLSIVCVSQYVVGKVVPSRGIEESHIREPSVSSVYTTNQVDINPAMLDEYDKIDFSSIEDLVTSLYSLTDIDNIGTMYEERLYDSSEDDIISVYHSSDNKVSAVVLPSGKISSCTFEGISEEDEALVKKYCEGTGYSIKVINGGFMLEPDVLVA